MALEKPQPTTAAELREEGLFKISAQIDIDLYKLFKNTCTNQGLKVKSQIEVAMLQHLKALDPEAFKMLEPRVTASGNLRKIRPEHDAIIKEMSERDFPKK